MLSSLIVLPGLRFGNPEWVYEYEIASSILDGQMLEAEESIMAGTFFSLPSGVEPSVYREGW